MKYLYLLFLLGFLVYFTQLMSSCGRAAREKSEMAPAAYVGAISCKSCHAAAYADWLGSHHDLAMQEATDSTVLGDFEDAVLESKGIQSRFFRRGSRFIVHTEGPEGKMQDFEIAYTFGYFPLQQYLVKFPGGRLQTLHLAWDSKAHKWFDLQPTERFKTDDWMHWTKGSMTWNNMCADCHSTNLQKNYDQQTDTYNTTWSIIDVSCEACHGPGSTHIEYIQSNAHTSKDKVKGSHLFLTGNLDNKTQVDQCARCHSLRSNQSLSYDHTGVYMDHYMPEVPNPSLYHPDGQIIEEVYVYGSFTQSRMYHEGVKCTNCHNPHSLKLKASGNALCTQCHISSTFDAPSHHFHPPGSEGAQCINCHMPGRYYMGNDFRRDHSLRVPRPDLSVRFNTPNACNDCHEAKGFQWQAEAVKRYYGPNRKPHYAEAFASFYAGNQEAGTRVAALVQDTAQTPTVQAMAVRYLSNAGAHGWQDVLTAALHNPSPLVRHTAIGAFQQLPVDVQQAKLLPLLKDPIRAVRAQAAYVLTAHRTRIPESYQAAYEAASTAYEKVLDAQADFAGGRLMRGQHEVHKGNYREAEQAFRAAITLDQDNAAASNALATFYYSQQRYEEAIQVYKRVISRNPQEAWAYFDLGLLLAEMNQLAEAATFLERAAKMAGDPRYFYNWGITLQNLGKGAAAEQAYLQGLKATEADYLLYALAVLYYQQGARTKARPLAAKLLQLAPQHAPYQQLAQAIGN